MAELISHTLKHALMITVFVMFMMILIEYINVQTKATWIRKLQKSPKLQIIIAGLLGIIPGCMGAFAVVSLYTHRMMSFAALVTVMIATSGDEAFVMLSLFPGKALFLTFILFIIAVVTGFIISYIGKNDLKVKPAGYVIHKDDYCNCFSGNIILKQLKHITFERAVLILFTSLFISLLLIGVIGPGEWDWKRIAFFIGGLFLLFVFFTVPDHFLKEHLYRHILRKHLLQLFLWTWGAFIVLHFVESNIEFTGLIKDNIYYVLLLAVLFGFIPQSGPQLLFVTMFSQSIIPFSILLSNSIVQDGHGILPLLAESRKDFIRVKIINMMIGFVIGGILLLFGL